jgi:hypothetical protein
LKVCFLENDSLIRRSNLNFRDSLLNCLIFGTLVQADFWDVKELQFYIFQKPDWQVVFLDGGLRFQFSCFPQRPAGVKDRLATLVASAILDQRGVAK